MTEEEIAGQDLSKLSPQQRYTLLMALITLAVTQLVAFIPSLGTDKQNLISAGGFVVTVAILIAGSIHHHAQAVVAVKKATVLSPADKLRAQIIAAGHSPEA